VIQLIGYTSVIENSSRTITYAYNVINDLREVTKFNVVESLVLLPTDIDAIAGDDAMLKFLNTRLNPVMPVVLGSITINYQVDGVNLEAATVLSNLPLATYGNVAKDFTGYTLVGDKIQSTILTASNLNVIVNFLYTKDVVQ